MSNQLRREINDNITTDIALLHTFIAFSVASSLGANNIHIFV